jgi:hypothetical protein
VPETLKIAVDGGFSQLALFVPERSVLLDCILVNLRNLECEEVRQKNFQPIRLPRLYRFLRGKVRDQFPELHGGVVFLDHLETLGEQFVGKFSVN